MMKRFAVILVCVLIVILFTPAQLGGWASYAIITGNSMEPSFRAGDLVVLRPSSVYSINDIVLYENPEIGPVFHRIVASAHNRFTFKGDHNSWTDSYQASHEDILGKYWFSIPELGAAVSFLHTPAGLAATTALAGGLVFGPKANAQGAKREHMKKVKQQESIARILGLSQISVRDSFLIFAAILLLLIPLGAYAFASPPYVTATVEYPYQHLGSFSYSSDVPAIGIYDQGYPEPGDPIFRQISNSFDLSFAYNLFAEGLEEVRGSYSLSATLGEPNGWTRTVELIPRTPFEGSSLNFSSKISINELQSIVDNFERTTGVDLPQYGLSVQPHIELIGLMRGVVWQDDFSPSLSFTVSDIEVRMNSSSENPQVLTQIKTGAATASGQQMNSLGFLGFKIDIQTLRTWLFVLLPTAAIATSIAGVKLLKLSRAGEASRIVGAFGPKLVDVTGMIETTPMKQISVHRIDDLVSIAEREGSSIFHERTPDSHYYFVEGRSGIYVYRLESTD